MPRPNPPRKRPRRRPDAAQRAARLAKQTAQSTQPRPGVPPPKEPGQRAAAVATAPPDEMWSRRSYAILIATIGAFEIVIGALLFLLAPNPKATIDLVAEMVGLQPYQPFPLLAACLLAAPVAKRITNEARSLRFVESLVVGVVIYLLFVLLATGVGFALTAGSSSSGSGTPTPCPTTASACPSPSATAQPTPTPTAAPSPSASANASPSPTPSVLGTTGGAISASTVVAAAGVANVIAYVLTVFVYPPLYKRLRTRPRPPAGGGRDQKSTKR